ncbi:hypothetical protein H2200_011341 [Cladophialophora chaetospira]|uniref:DUF6536 domain-containing protein n=1 Tax=Cladophialophora chaetospira TaxID=386627 RepID=A0AA39CDN2_9EURO|nr:hypothetical protein H2200_011341 [Cladophialophora chaetospira]
MDSGAKRRHAPQWPPFKQPYQQLKSTENVQLTPLPRTGSSSLPSASIFSPDLHSATAYTPDPPASTPQPLLLKSPGTTGTAGSKRRFTTGWKTSSRIALGCVIGVLVTNICLTIGFVTTGMKMMGGNCKKVETKDTWVHLGLNVVATALLASSNYCMQLLSSPSRSEVNKAHAKQKWLDIGIASVRNLRFLRKKKIVLWWILGISSVPLHLVLVTSENDVFLTQLIDLRYNSVFYSALATNNYSVLYTSQSFIQGATYDKTKFPDTGACNVTEVQAGARAGNYTVLNNEDCIHAYARDFVEDRRNVIVVVKNPPSNEGSVFNITQNEFPEKITSQYNPYAWICENPDVVNQTGTQSAVNKWGFIPCSKITPKLVDVADQWKTGGFEVDHCLSEPVESQCHLHFNLILMSVVLGFNVLKAIGVAYVVFSLGEAPLITVGDALQSFICNPDSTTEGMCLASHQSIVAASKLGGYKSMPMRYDPKQHRFYEAATWRQWTFLLVVFSFAGAGTAICLALGISNFASDRTIQNAWSIGLGQVRPQNLVMGWNIPGYESRSVMISTLIANAPQALFSFLYVCYNGLFTIMFLARELMNFSVTSGRGRKYLRVSEAKGEQKSTYFLQLPFKYGIPLLIGSGLMHWLVSQSVFLANISIIPRDGSKPMQDEITTVAYSPIGMLFMLFVGLFLIIFILATALRKLPFGMPLIGSNSMAISAACHLPPGMHQDEREEMVLRPLSWGAVPNGGKVMDLGIRDVHAHGFGDDLDEDGRSFGHCCISDRVLDVPVKGKFYV